jgi:hypothetical protein
VSSALGGTHGRHRDGLHYFVTFVAVALPASMVRMAADVDRNILKNMTIVGSAYRKPED